MAWSALRTASELADRGRIEGSVASWRDASAAVQRAVLSHGQGPDGELGMSFPEPEADSSLLAAYLVSFISPDQVGAEPTLRRSSRDLGRGPRGARHWPERNGIDFPCFPSIFPGLGAAARWGNYPQVQSQAALREAVLASWFPERRAENRGRR